MRLPPRVINTKVIDLIDVNLLKIAAPATSLASLRIWVEPIKEACRTWGIDTVREISSFLANASHECAGFTKMEESLYYSAKRLGEVWPNRFNTEAKRNAYAKNPEKLANFTYANRMGNGDEFSGDGWRHRGYGLFQLTGKLNHSRFGLAMGIPLANVPAYIRTTEGAAMSAGWYWYDNGMDVKAATPGIADDRKAIQGGSLGVTEVGNIFDKLIKELLRRGA